MQKEVRIGITAEHKTHETMYNFKRTLLTLQETCNEECAISMVMEDDGLAAEGAGLIPPDMSR